MAPAVDAAQIVELLRTVAQTLVQVQAALASVQANVVEDKSVRRQTLLIMRDIAQELNLARHDRRRIDALEARIAAIAEDDRERERIRILIDDVAAETIAVTGRHAVIDEDKPG